MAVCGRDEDRAAGVSSLTNEEPLVIVKACVDIMWEVVREDCGDSRGSVVREGETPLHRGGCRSVCEGTFGAENGDVSRSWGRSIHWGSEVFAARGGDKGVIRVDGDILVERGKEEGVEDFLSYLGGRERHCR